MEDLQYLNFVSFILAVE